MPIEDLVKAEHKLDYIDGFKSGLKWQEDKEWFLKNVTIGQMNGWGRKHYRKMYRRIFNEPFSELNDVLL